MRKDARDGGDDYRILMPDSKKPAERISEWLADLGQYDRFLDDEPPGPSTYADRIRQHVFERYVKPAKEDGRRQAEVLVRTVNEELGLDRQWPNICQALAGRRFQELAQVPPPRADRP